MWWLGFCIWKARPPRGARADCRVRTARRPDGKPADAFDYYCWDLYARTSQWYGREARKKKPRAKSCGYDTLHEIEQGGNETAEIAELISTAVLRRHLETMQRLGH